MPNRRDFLRSGIAAIAGLAGLVDNAYSSPHFQHSYPIDISASSNKKDLSDLRDLYIEIEQLRREYMFTYEEWKKFRHFFYEVKQSEIDSEPKHPLQIKAQRMLDNPEIVSKIINEDEVKDFANELILFDSDIDPGLICQMYKLQLPRSVHFSNTGELFLSNKYDFLFLFDKDTSSEFRKNFGAMILWSLHRHYSYRYSDETTQKRKKSSK